MPSGRPSLGVRKQVNVRMPVDLITRIDQARGIISRDSWMEQAAELALRPTSVYVNPELKQTMHEHRASRPKRTEWKNGQRIRVFECECGTEVVA